MAIEQLILQAIVSVLTAILASGGLWGYLSKKQDIRYAELERKRKEEAEVEEKNDVKTKLLVGLAHDRLIYLTNKYLEEGWIDSEDYENLTYMYEPYIEGGGNGSVKRNMKMVKELPTKPNHSNWGIALRSTSFFAYLG